MCRSTASVYLHWQQSTMIISLVGMNRTFLMYQQVRPVSTEIMFILLILQEEAGASLLACIFIKLSIAVCLTINGSPRSQACLSVHVQWLCLIHCIGIYNICELKSNTEDERGSSIHNDCQYTFCCSLEHTVTSVHVCHALVIRGSQLRKYFTDHLKRRVFSIPMHAVMSAPLFNATLWFIKVNFFFKFRFRYLSFLMGLSRKMWWDRWRIFVWAAAADLDSNNTSQSCALSFH